MIYFFGNFKMEDVNLTSYTASILPIVKRLDKKKVTVALAYQYPFISNSKFLRVSQDVSSHLVGAYTGEVSVTSLAKLKVKYCLVGHSERRKYHHEDSKLLHDKIKLLLEHKIIPIFCIGESLEQYEEGISREVVLQQVTDSLQGFTKKEISSIIIAYEPVWAIGTGKVASGEYASTMHRYISSVLRKQLKSKAKALVYGGSVNEGNIENLLSYEYIDGVLVGKASTVPEKTKKMLEIIESL